MGKELFSVFYLNPNYLLSQIPLKDTLMTAVCV